MLLERCPWYIAGPILGALIFGLRVTVNRPLGALGGYIDVVEHAARPWRLGFSACVLAGIVMGGTLFTLSTGSFLPVALYRGLTDPRVIRDMLRLKEAHVFLIMSSAVVIAAVGVRLLAMVGARAIVTHEPIGWTVERAQVRHVAGSMVFAVGWTVAGTCPGPVAAMIGQGQLIGLPVATGLFAGVMLQGVFMRTPKVESRTPATAATAGL